MLLMLKENYRYIESVEPSLCFPHPINVQCAEYLLCILSRLTAHRSNAEMPLKLMKSDKPTGTFVDKLSMTKKKEEERAFFNCKTCTLKNMEAVWMDVK